MTLQPRDRRALLILGGAAVFSLVFYFWPMGDAGVEIVSASPSSIPQAEQRLARLRQSVAGVPARQNVLDQVAAQVREREKALLPGETAAQAQATLLKTVQRLARAQAPPIDLGQVDMGPIRRLGKDYGETLVSVSMNCRIEQLVNLLADISAQPELIATHDLRVSVADSTQKTINVRLTVSGVIARTLVPERKGGVLF
jgi:hypothetical protein